MDRRRFLLTSVTGALMPARAAGAQQAAKVHRVGYVVQAPSPWPRSIRDATNPLGAAFDDALHDAGLIEGTNVVVDRRYMEGREGKYPDVLADLEGAMDVIVAAGAPAALAAKKYVTKVPVVFVAVGDPVAIGLVHSLGRPGGNITGVAFDVSPEIAGKRLSLLKELTPTLHRVAVLWSSTDPVGIPALHLLDNTAARLAIIVKPFDVRDADALEQVFRQIEHERFDGILVIGGPVNVLDRTRIIDFTSTHRLPAISVSRDFVEYGGLMAYGPDVADNVMRVVSYVQRILKGAKPANLPVEQPIKFELVINVKTAKVLGVTISPSLLLRADLVTEFSERDAKREETDAHKAMPSRRRPNPRPR